jgi:3-hydroxyacyl-[acyl-carrier-protein] dehydratase
MGLNFENNYRLFVRRRSATDHDFDGALIIWLEYYTKKQIMWYEVSFYKQMDNHVLAAEIRVPKESPWFDGHFPGNPVLPGVAQLSMIFDVIQNAFKESIKVTSIRRVRFKQMILPEDRLKVVVEPRKLPQDYSFRINRDDELICSGNITVDTSLKKSV